MLCCAMFCLVTLGNVMLFLSRYVIQCYVLLFNVMFFYLMLCYVVKYYVF